MSVIAAGRDRMGAIWRARTNAEWRRRIAVGLALVALQLAYFPINRLVAGGVTLALPLDEHIPLWSIWVIPYLLSLPAWLVFVVWSVVGSVTRRRLNAFALAFAAVLVTSYLIYLAFPTYVERPAVTTSGATRWMLHAVYSLDRPYNAFPSGHTYTTVLIALFLGRWYPRRRGWWAAAAVLVVLSTLFTRQHVVLDLAGGGMLALAGFALGNRLICVRGAAGNC